MRLLGQFKLFFTKRSRTKSTNSTKAQPSKSTNAQNANKQISDFFPYMFLSAFFIPVCLFAFCAFLCL